MREELIKKLTNELNNKVNNGAKEEEISTLCREVKKRLNKDLPDAYLDILRKINGFEYNGFILYGVDEEYMKETPIQKINGYIFNNLAWYDNEWQEQYLFFGESSISWYVYDTESEKYCELDCPSGDLIEEYETIDDLINKLLEDS